MATTTSDTYRPFWTRVVGDHGDVYSLRETVLDAAFWAARRMMDVWIINRDPRAETGAIVDVLVWQEFDGRDMTTWRIWLPPAYCRIEQCGDGTPQATVGVPALSGRVGGAAALPARDFERRLTMPDPETADLLPSSYRRQMSEAVLTEAVKQAAGYLGWRAYHTWLAAKSAPGFPDLVLVNLRQRRTLFVELKSATGRLTVQQAEWLAALDEAGQEVHLWTPAEWHDGTVERVLRGD